MNRTGLFIALGLALVVGLLFGLYPELDLKIAALFFDAATKTFPLKASTWASIARDGAMWVAWALVMPALIAFVVKLLRPVKPLMISGRAMVFLLVTMLLSAIVLSNIVFKGYWGRPRPVVVTQFDGKLDFVPWWDPRGKCPKNCSFFSGEGATAFWTYAPAALTPPAWRPGGLCGCNSIRPRHGRSADDIWRPFRHGRAVLRHRLVPRGLAGLCLHLSLAVDAADRFRHRHLAHPAWHGQVIAGGRGYWDGISAMRPASAPGRKPQAKVVPHRIAPARRSDLASKGVPPIVRPNSLVPVRNVSHRTRPLAANSIGFS